MITKAAPPILCACGLPAPYKGRVCQSVPRRDLAVDEIKDSPDRPRCIVKGCTNPRYRYDYGPHDYCDIPRCAKHRAEFNARTRDRYKAKRDGLLQPKPLRINFKIDGGNRADIEASAAASGMSVEQWAAHHLLWAATLPRDAMTTVEKQDADFQAEIQGCLDELVERGEIKRIKHEGSEDYYTKI